MTRNFAHSQNSSGRSTRARKEQIDLIFAKLRNKKPVHIITMWRRAGKPFVRDETRRNGWFYRMKISVFAQKVLTNNFVLFSFQHACRVVEQVSEFNYFICIRYYI